MDRCSSQERISKVELAGDRLIDDGLDVDLFYLVFHGTDTNEFITLLLDNISILVFTHQIHDAFLFDFHCCW